MTTMAAKITSIFRLGGRETVTRESRSCERPIKKRASLAIRLLYSMQFSAGAKADRRFSQL